MRFGTKMMIAFTLTLALAFGVCGSALITSSTANALKQSQDSAASAHRLILYSLTAAGGTSEDAARDREYNELIDTLTQLDAQGGQNWLSLRLSDGDGVIYASRSPGLYRDDLTRSSDFEQFAMLAFRSGDGAYLLQIAGQFSYGTRTLYLESMHNLDNVYGGRQAQQAIYRQLFIIVVAVGALLSWLLSFWMTAPLRRLSRVTRTIASGDLHCRASLGGKDDEIGTLAADFNDMADRLEQNINDIKSAMQRQEEFMGGLAHELKTPMTSIIGYADLLRGHTLSDEDKRDAANYIFMEGRRLEVLSLKLLDLIVMKKRDFTFLPISLGSIIDDAARLLKPALAKLGVKLVCDCDEAVGMIEPDLFMSLLLNLIDNARKAMDEGGEITIRARAAGRSCLVMVTDNGRGIPAEELSKIKDAFYRVDKSRSRSQGGVGLGLRLCDEIAALHGGALQFDSAPGKGTTVTITLRSSERSATS